MADYGTIIFYQPRDLDAAIAHADEHGGTLRSAKGWNGVVEETADHVVVGAGCAAIADAYRADGATVASLHGHAAPEPVSEPEPDPEPETADGVLPDGYHIEQSGSWYKVVDDYGEQVGNAKRSEAEAIAQVVGD